MRKLCGFLGLLLPFLAYNTSFAATGRVVLRFSSPNFAKSVVYEEIQNPPNPLSQGGINPASQNVPAFPNYEEKNEDVSLPLDKEGREGDFGLEKEDAQKPKPPSPLYQGGINPENPEKSRKQDAYSPILVFAEPEKPDVIIDSDLTWAEAIENVPSAMPQHILDDLRLISVDYLGFDGNLRRGQIIIHKDVEEDIIGFFDLALELEFPIYSVIPISQFGWDDFASMFANNTHAFDWRNATMLDFIDLYHGYGHAIDINPRLNPYYRGDVMFPANGTYDVNEPGTLYHGHPIVDYFDEKGWNWGGYWHVPLDLHHFQKALPEDK